MQLENVSKPVRIVADTTRRCNLSCWYCHSTSGPDYKGPEIAGEKMSDIFKIANDNKIFDVTLTGGETLLWKGLSEAMEASQELYFPALAIITNATTVSESRIKTLQKGKIQRINVSLDGVGEYHERNRGDGSYNRTIRGIQELRQVVDNITVISVLDNTNYDKWQLLTDELIKMGVKQHHLTPVCYSGNARSQYRGLTEDQFAEVRTNVEKMTPNLPFDFKLRFGDTLIRGFDNREVPIHLFVEGFKGWQIHIRPDGLVKGHTKVWGRNWRTDEVLGNINETSLAEVMNGYEEKVRGDVQSRFSMQEEVARKFHIGDHTEEITVLDTRDMDANEDGNIGNDNSISQTNNYDQIGSKVAQELTDRMNIATSPQIIRDVVYHLITQPERYRFRNENGFGFFFDRETFDMVLLTADEQFQIDNLIKGN